MRALEIVLIEDNPGDVRLVQMALDEAELPHQLTRFKNGHEAMESLCATPGKAGQVFVPDAILMDLNTPRSDGFEVLKRLKETEHLSGVPIAIMTSSPAISDKNRSRTLGAECYIEKPASLDDFLNVVGTAVKKLVGNERLGLPALYSSQPA
jgi:two-component system, chemotaxis family, response regulator Rcp1